MAGSNTVRRAVVLFPQRVLAARGRLVSLVAQDTPEASVVTFYDGCRAGVRPRGGASILLFGENKRRRRRLVRNLLPQWSASLGHFAARAGH